MSFEVLNDDDDDNVEDSRAQQQQQQLRAAGAEGEEKKRRRKKRNKKKKNAAADGPASAEAVIRICAEAGFTEDEIAFGRAEMEERGLAYDHPNVVKIYLETRRKHLEEHRKTLAANKTPRRKESGGTPQQAPSSTAPEPAPAPAPEPMPAPAPTPESTRERLLGVLSSVQDVDPILDGLQMWVRSVSREEQVVLGDREVLGKLFETVMGSVALSPEPLPLSSLNVIRRKLGVLLASLLQTDPQALAGGAGALVDAGAQMRGSDPADIGAVAGVAAIAVAQQVSASGPDAPSESPRADTAPNEIADLRQGAAVLSQLEKAIVPSVPRGDKLVVQAGGEQLSAGEVGRLFRLRDAGKRAAEVAARCADIANADDASTKAPAELDPAAARMQEFLGALQQEARSAQESAAQAKAELTAITSASTEGNNGVASIEAARDAARGELQGLEAERAKLAAELASLDERIAESTSSLRALEDQISRDKASADANLVAISSRASSTAAAARDAQQKLAAATRVQRFGDDLKAALCSQKPQEADVKAEWAARAAFAMDRYLAVEAACIKFLKARAEGADARVAEYESKATNLAALGMQTLANEAKSRSEQESKHKAEDTQALAVLTQAVEKSAASLPGLVHDSLPPAAVAALHRCLGYLRQIGIDAELPGLPAAPLSGEAKSPVQKAKPAISTGAGASAPSPVKQSSWSGWGKPQAQPAAPSLRAILAEESATQDGVSGGPSAETADEISVADDDADDAKPQAEDISALQSGEVGGEEEAVEKTPEAESGLSSSDNVANGKDSSEVRGSDEQDTGEADDADGENDEEQVSEDVGLVEREASEAPGDVKPEEAADDSGETEASEAPGDVKPEEAADDSGGRDASEATGDVKPEKAADDAGGRDASEATGDVKPEEAADDSGEPETGETDDIIARNGDHEAPEAAEEQDHGVPAADENTGKATEADASAPAPEDGKEEKDNVLEPAASDE